MYHMFKVLMAMIIFMIFSWYYTGWLRDTFPNPITLFVITLTSGMIIGGVLVFLSFRKFRQEVAIDKNLPPGCVLVRIKPDKLNVNSHSSAQPF